MASALRPSHVGVFDSGNLTIYARPPMPEDWWMVADDGVPADATSSGKRARLSATATEAAPADVMSVQRALLEECTAIGAVGSGEVGAVVADLVQGVAPPFSTAELLAKGGMPLGPGQCWEDTDF